jgi:putative SbcD/Mre11-related phosphoesterase
MLREKTKEVRGGKTEICRGVEITGLGLYLKKSRLLAVADLHLGYEEMLNKAGVMVPRFNFREIKARLEKIFSETGKPETIVINGDLKHEMGTISGQEWREVLDMLDFLSSRCSKIILIKGNHDNILGPIAEKKKVKVMDEFFAGKEKVLFIHGHKIPEKKKLKDIKTVIIGHEHPAVAVRDGVKEETYKCFLKGSFEGKALIVMPSMNSVYPGSDVTKEEALSPLIKETGEFESYAVEDKAYFLGKVKNL